MKIAFYSDEGRDQIVLTPATDHERAMLKKLRDPGVSLKVFEGSFYECQGGWTRQGLNENSTILVIEPRS